MTPAVASPSPVVLPHQSADHALLQRLIEQERIAQAVPDPAWSDYLVRLARAGLDGLEALLSPMRDILAGLGLPMKTVAVVLFGLLAGMIVVLATIAVLRLVRGRRPEMLPRDAIEKTLEPAPRDPDVWRALLEERLRAGGISDALEAVWWWLAASVSRGPVDPSWTSRELLLRAGRPDLGPWAAALDRMTYGARRPDAEAVRGLVHALESSV